MPPTRCALKEYRLRKGLSQEELATMVQIRRQAVYDMETGRYLPNTAVALRLARVLGCTVEALFGEAPQTGGGPLSLSRLIEFSGATVGAGTARLALARVRGNLVGVPLQGTEGLFSLRPADGLLRQGACDVEPLLPAATLEKTVLILGCDPALDLLHAHMERLAPGLRVHAVFASSRRALHALAEGAAHVAGTHFYSADGAEANLEAVRSLLPGAPSSLIAFARQEEGLMVASGNPLGIREIADLARPDVRLANREEGAALRKLLDNLLLRHGIPPAAVAGYEALVRSHCEGAFHVACGSADAALGLRVIAESFGLGFVPLAVTRCDLVIPGDLQDHPGVAVLLDMLQSARLRRELSALPGYDASVTGTIIARPASGQSR